VAKQIDEKTLAVLSRVTVEGNLIFLTCGQLDRKDYEAVNKVLEIMGGKWNRSRKAHVFSEDPTDALEQVLTTGEITPPQKYGYFPTPPELAQHVARLAAIAPPHAILEPSAGQGGLVDFLSLQHGVTCVELLPENAKVLREKGYAVREGDFLSISPTPIYDRVVMNPPFERQQDIDHVLHAWKFLKPGGRLVAIMASSVTFRENRKTLDFRVLLDAHGSLERNPAGSFKVSGTMVETVTVVMDKPL
jgi:hypothetical protein